MYFLPFLILGAPLIAAINFTAPTADEQLSRGSSYNVTWNTVDTDPDTFSVYLWNFVAYPPFYSFLEAVETAAGSVSITIPCDLQTEDGWQLTAIGGSNVYVIYAQTPKFSIDDTVCSSPTVGSDPEACVASTVTVTGTLPTGTNHPTGTNSLGQCTVTSALSTMTVTSTVTAKATPWKAHPHKHHPNDAYWHRR